MSFQHQNSSFPPSGGGNFGNRQNQTIFFAIYPKNINPEHLASWINQRFGNQGCSISVYDDRNRPNNFPYTKMVHQGSPNTLNQILATNGEVFQNQIVFISQIDKKQEQFLINFFNQNFDRFVKDDCLNLSNLKEHGISNVTDYTTSFILFLCAIKCNEQGIVIREINYSDNGQTTTKGFNNFAPYFPEIQKVYFANNPLNNQTNQLEPFLPPNRDPIEFVLTEASTRGWGTGLVQDLPKPYDAILKTVPRGVPIPSTRPKFVLGNFIPATINPEESPIHHLILDFFDCCWRDMKTIGKYYHPHAVFSATMDVDVDNMIPRFKSFNRDYCDNHVKMGPVAVGPIEISQRLCDLFGPGFYAHPTSYVFNLFMPECCGLVVHGAFQVDEGKKSYVYCFDRSFLIGVVDNGIFIINDHIFIRTAKLPGSL